MRKTFYIAITVFFALCSDINILAQTAEKSTVMASVGNIDENDGMISASGVPVPKDIRNKVIEGNKLLDKGQFGMALPIWLEILKETPENADVNFKVGLCYRYSLDQQDKALPYLKKAATKTIAKYNFYNMKWGEASFDAIYFLAETFLINNEPDSALNYFLIYNDVFDGNPPINIDRQIHMCVNAKNAGKSPRNVKLTNMGKILNSDYSETNPVVTVDNSVIFFASRRPRPDGTNKDMIDKVTGTFYQDIYSSKRAKDGTWETPVYFRYNSDLNDIPLFISMDGLTFYFAKEEKTGDLNLYETHYANGAWGQPQPLGSPINTAFNENGLTVTSDGKTLYFSSDRPDGQGNMDIYQCKKLANGHWGKAKNIGNKINTPYNEIYPFVSPNGRTLFYSSNGYRGKSIGGFDIYYTEIKDDGTFTEPKNMGYPINTTKENFNYYVTSGGLRYCSQLNEGKSYDLYRIEGGGLDIENIDMGKDVVMLTTEMNVTEVVEVEKQVTKEVEVVNLMDNTGNDQTKDQPLDLEAAAKQDSINAATIKANTDSVVAVALAKARQDSISNAIAKVKADSALDAERKSKANVLESLKIEDLDSVSRDKLIQKVKVYLAAELKTNQSVVFKTLYFDFNHADLSMLSKTELKAFLEFMKENPKAKVEIVGHADSKGPWDANVRVSGERAKTVYEYLVDHRVNPKKMNYYGRGVNSPVASNDSEAGRKQNRRVEIVITK